MNTTRRQLMASAGTTALLASLGSELFALPRLSHFSASKDDKLHLGRLEPLAQLLQEVQPAELLPRLVELLRSGTSLEHLVSAGALANARSLGGTDYEGYHAFMAMWPALAISRELPLADQPLPVLKTLKRSALRMQSAGSSRLKRVDGLAGNPRTALHRGDLQAAERALAASGKGGPEEAWRALQPVITDDIEVHLVVFAWRAKEISDLAGPEHAVTCMRQILHFADAREAGRRRDRRPEPPVRSVVPALLDAHGLLDGELGTRDPGAERVSKLADVLASSSREEGAAAAATALAQGFDPRSVGEALSLASTRLLLRDPGRTDAAKGRPLGSVHGAGTGVHASDSALAWREIAASVQGVQRATALIAGAFHTAGQGSYVSKRLYPFAEHREATSQIAVARLGDALSEAVRGGHQARAGAIAARMNELDLDEKAFETLRPIAVAQDGALHSEKYQHTSRVVHGLARRAFRQEHLIAFARVVASQACAQAPEVAEARELLG
jgi:hypothetical protein